MEGPSIALAVEQLTPFINKKILKVDGNTRIGKERLSKQKLVDIFSWGKHLVFQFNDFALRVHFMLFGSYEAEIKGKKVTGDYPKKQAVPRLAFFFTNGHIIFYSCSLKYLESNSAKDLYDFSIDTFSPEWNSLAAFKKVKKQPTDQIGDLLLEQTLFAGVGNIIKNEVLFLNKTLPEKPISDLKDITLKAIIKTVREYVFQFYEWRKQFVLKKHYQIYRQSLCPVCKQKVTRKKTGKRMRNSFFCLNCQN